MSMCCLLDGAGKLALALVGLRLAQAVWRMVFPYFMAARLGQGRKLSAHLRAGEWAVVTGATDGIGKEYARELVRQYEANVVLVGRNAAKLADVRGELEALREGVKIKLVTFDFAHAQPEDYAKVGKELEGLEVGCLVNSVGISYTELGSVGKVPNGERLSADLLSVNCLSVVLMSRLVVEGMAARGRGAIINIASSSGVFPTAFLSVYAASKRFVTYLGECMREEYKGQGILLQTVSPFFVATKMSGMKPSFTCPKPDAYVRQALATIGHQSETFGCFSHSLQGEVMRLVPACVLSPIFKSMMAGLMAKQQRRKAKAQ